MIYTIRQAAPDDVRPALDLALRVFMKYEAPEYGAEATARFKADIVYNEDFIRNWQNGTNLMYAALDGDNIVGVIGEKWNNGHINLLFVDGKYHRRGIATALTDAMASGLKSRGHGKLTVFSSPYGLPFYLNYGFTPTDEKQRKDGFIFTPMAYDFKEIEY